MEIIRTAKPEKKMADVNVWLCEGCGVVHMALDKTVVNFTREEFGKFTESVVDINYSGWLPGSGEHSIIDLASSGTHDTKGHTVH